MRQLDVRQSVARHALRMEQKLADNDRIFRGEWVAEHLSMLLNGLSDELQEFLEAIEDEDVESAALEAADVSNYCMMLVDRLENRKETRGRSLE